MTVMTDQQAARIARDAAQRIVRDFRTAVTAICLGAQLSGDRSMISEEMINDLRDAVDLLEGNMPGRSGSALARG
jgi:hypothetical protein